MPGMSPICATAGAGASAISRAAVFLPLLPLPETYTTSVILSGARTSARRLSRYGVPFRRDPPPITRAYVLRARPNQPPVGPLLERVGDPSADASDRKRRRKEGYVELESVQQEGGIELEVRLESASRLV